jgi:hypothetical protein
MAEPYRWMSERLYDYDYNGNASYAGNYEIPR